MFKTARLELRRFPLYWWVPVLLACCVLFARYTYPMAIEGRTVQDRRAIYPESREERQELERLLEETMVFDPYQGSMVTTGINYNEYEDCYTFTDERLADISPGGELYEEGSELYLKVKLYTAVDNTLFEYGDELALSKFYLEKSMIDASAPFFISWVLPALFFARNFSRRMAGAAVSRGVDRGAYFRGKLLVYLLIAAVVSAADLVVCAATMERIGGAEVAKLSQGYILRCFATRFLLDILCFCVPVGICVLFRRYILATIVTVAVSMFLLRQRDTIGVLYIGAFYCDGLWQPELETGGVLALLRQLILPVISVVGGYMLFRRVTLK